MLGNIGTGVVTLVFVNMAMHCGCMPWCLLKCWVVEQSCRIEDRTQINFFLVWVKNSY